MSASHTFLKFARQLHLYTGVFIAPAVLFFAFTGALQVVGLHETSRDSDYRPPAWLAVASQLHKKQTDVLPVRRAWPVKGIGSAAGAPQASVPRRHPLPLKIFAALVAFGLVLSTLLGLYMAYRYTRKYVLISAILGAGAIFPTLLALL